MVIDSQTLMLAAANFFVTSIGKGDRHGGGGRHRMASAVSQQADGCFVVKASEKDCGTAANPPAATATFDVFCNRKVPEKVLIMASETGAAEEAPVSTQLQPHISRAEFDEAMAAKDAEMDEMRARLAKFEAAAASPTKKRWFSLGPSKGRGKK